MGLGDSEQDGGRSEFQQWNKLLKTTSAQLLKVSSRQYKVKSTGWWTRWPLFSVLFKILCENMWEKRKKEGKTWEYCEYSL